MQTCVCQTNQCFVRQQVSLYSQLEKDLNLHISGVIKLNNSKKLSNPHCLHQFVKIGKVCTH